jgi:ATP-dependent RNA helicase DeaD
MSSQNIHPALAAALEARGYETLTPVQLAVIEPQARDRDLLVSARTGSGKTVAYGLVLADTLFAADGTLAPAGKPSALVIAPTRELAMQVQRELQWLYSGARVVACVGGMDPRAERRALDAGCQIVVGTPGRLRDHLERGNLRLDELGAVILDEADEMLDLGFREEIEEILDSTPKDRRTLLFSATLPKPIVALAATYQNNALRLTVGGGDNAHTDIEYRAMRIAPSEVELATVNVLRYFESSAALVFCNTRDGVRKLHANLVERGFNVVALSGELTQNERTHALQALRDRRARVCVATDVAARGIDIPDLDLVIHADIPVNRETLQHRSGRTGRAGRKGICVLLVPHPKRRKLDLLLKGAKIEAVWQSPPTAEDIRAQDETRLIEAVLPAAEGPEDDLAVARALMDKRAPEDIAAAYVRLARTQMPAPEDLSESEPEPQGYAPGQGRYKDRGDRFEGRSRTPGPERIDPPRPGFEDAVWFKIDLGRNKNAEARWILPMLCRRGHATKGDIGAIRIFDRETRFQVVAQAVERFEAAAAKNDGDGGRIQRLEDGAAAPGADPPAPRSAPPRDEVKPFQRPREDARPFARPREDGPLPRKFRERTATPEPAWSPVERAAAPTDRVKPPYKGKQPHPKPKKKRKPNG